MKLSPLSSVSSLSVMYSKSELLKETLENSEDKDSFEGEVERLEEKKLGVVGWEEGRETEEGEAMFEEAGLERLFTSITREGVVRLEVLVAAAEQLTHLYSRSELLQ